MTAYNYLYLIAIGLVVVGWSSCLYAEPDVTVAAGSSSSSSGPQNGLAPDGTPIVHKSLHKKKTGTNSASSLAVTPKQAASASGKVSTAPTKAPSSVTSLSAPIAPAKTAATIPTVTSTAPPGASSLPTVTVETGFPVARHAGTETLGMFEPLPIPTSATLPAVSYGTSKSTVPPPAPPKQAAYEPAIVGAVPGLTTQAPPTMGSTPGSAPPASRTLVERKSTHTYPWKTNIITTMFWIGEGGSSISPTTQLSSAWIEDWRGANGGSDRPEQRHGYLPSGHAATVNPFYVALPFNDLAYPDKAKKWVPASWHRKPDKDGHQVSACKDRWVEIKNEDGDRCFAQWEDVGPLRSDHAEYVFGNERPYTYTRAGLDVSPAVARCLGISDKKRITRWHFVDDEDVPPGPWLKYDEQAVIFAALKELKDNDRPRVPIQKASTPIDDKSNIDSNKKKVGAAKG